MNHKHTTTAKYSKMSNDELWEIILKGGVSKKEAIKIATEFEKRFPTPPEVLNRKNRTV